MSNLQISSAEDSSDEDLSSESEVDLSEDDSSEDDSVEDLDLDLTVEDGDDDGEDQVNPWLRVYPPEDEEADPHPFTQNAGPKNVPPPDAAPIDYFNLFCTIGLLASFVRETNRYARQHFARFPNPKPHSYVNLWKKDGETNVREMKAFLAVIINMGLIRKPTLLGYWTKKIRSQVTSWFGDMFARNRFLCLLKFFHLKDNTTVPRPGEDNYDPCAKFSDLVDHTNAVFREHYTPSRELSVDESLIGTKNRTQLIQYLPNKHHHKWGIKLWMLCEAITGYVLAFTVYRGKRDNTGPEQGLTQKVVLKLIEMGNYFRKGYHIFCDNFFTSIELARELFRRGTYLTGTIRRNRKGLPNVIKGKVDVGGSVYSRKDELLAVAYRQRKTNKNPVLLLSTKINAENVEVQKRHPGPDGAAVELKPKMVDAYNHNMGGIDQADMMLYAYIDERRTVKFWKKVVFSIISRMIVNAYIIYKQNTSDRKKMSRYKFTALIVDALAKEHLDYKEEMDETGDPGGRGIRKIPGEKEKDCTVCSDRKNKGPRKRARTQCVKCLKGLHGECAARHKCKN